MILSHPHHKASLLAPPAHGDWPLGPTRGPTVQRASGGAWGDASPQTPAIRTARVAWDLDMGNGLWSRNGLWSSLSSMRHDCPRPLQAPRLANGTRPAASMAGPGTAIAYRAHQHPRPYPHTLFMAGVWGEASPQAPPEARWTVGPRVGPRGQSAMGGGRETDSRRGQGG